MSDLKAKDSVVLFDVADGVATLTLNRPAQYNALSRDVMQGIIDAVENIRRDDSIRVAVLTGAGRGFCSGADLGDGASLPQRETGDAADFHPIRDIYNPAVNALKSCPVPIVSRINGAAAGGGFGLALASDITIAARSAFFVATFSPRLGIVPDMGATWSLPRSIGRARALGASLLGDRISAEQAVEWGLIWACVDDDKLDEEISRVVMILKRSSPDAVVRTRDAIDLACVTTFNQQLAVELAHQDVLLPRHMREGAAAFREKRDPVFGPERYKSPDE